jgi:hypothetical protein
MGKHEREDVYIAEKILNDLLAILTIVFVRCYLSIVVE